MIARHNAEKLEMKAHPPPDEVREERYRQMKAEHLASENVMMDARLRIAKEEETRMQRIYRLRDELRTEKKLCETEARKRVEASLPPARQNLEGRLREFYGRVCPEKLEEMDAILNEIRFKPLSYVHGRLLQKYGESPFKEEEVGRPQEIQIAPGHTRRYHELMFAFAWA